jgi:hypothetical protein
MNEAAAVVRPVRRVAVRASAAERKMARDARRGESACNQLTNLSTLSHAIDPAH